VVKCFGERRDALDDLDCHPDPDTHWCVAELALQQWLGLWPGRPGGYNSDNRGNSGIVRQNLADGLPWGQP
jgi:hypothetical protein